MLTQLTGVLLNAPPVGRVLRGGEGGKTGSVLVWWSVQKKTKKCCFVKENYFVKKRGRGGERVLIVQC